MPKGKIIYLDNAATTSVDPMVLKEMLPYFSQKYGNASSLHQSGLDGLVAIDSARAKIAQWLDCRPANVYFTSGATESDNWVILGVVRGAQRLNPAIKPHLIVSAIEHEAVLEPVKKLLKDGLIEVTYLRVNKNGLVSGTDLQSAIKSNTVLVSVMLANNEIGVIQPIADLAKIIAEANLKRQNKIYFHTDATQAPAYLDCSVKKLGVDLMSISAHKVYGPKGVGALYIKDNIKLEPLMLGGGQQGGKRSGTYNVSGIVGFGKAIELVADRKKFLEENKRIKKLRDYLITGILKNVPRSSLNGDRKKRLPNNASFTIPGVEGESVLLMLSQSGICVSTGSACSSGSLEPSHVLLAIGVPIENAHGSLRVTLGRFTKQSDVDALTRSLPKIVKKLRQMSPLEA